jgi:hypothetical protein
MQCTSQIYYFHMIDLHKILGIQILYELITNILTSLHIETFPACSSHAR